MIGKIGSLVIKLDLYFFLTIIIYVMKWFSLFSGLH